MSESGLEVQGIASTPQPEKKGFTLAKLPVVGRFFGSGGTADTIQSGITMSAPPIADKMTSSADAATLSTDATQGSQDIGVGHAVSPSSSVDNVVNDTMASIDQQMSASNSTADIAAGMAAHANNPGVLMGPSQSQETITPTAAVQEKPAA